MEQDGCQRKVKGRSSSSFTRWATYVSRSAEPVGSQKERARRSLFVLVGQRSLTQRGRCVVTPQALSRLRKLGRPDTLGRQYPGRLVRSREVWWRSPISRDGEVSRVGLELGIDLRTTATWFEPVDKVRTGGGVRTSSTGEGGGFGIAAGGAVGSSVSILDVFLPRNPSARALDGFWRFLSVDRVHRRSWLTRGRRPIFMLTSRQACSGVDAVQAARGWQSYW